MKNATISRVLWLLSIALVLTLPTASRAVPYASSVTESGGTVTFHLNENADSVKVVRTGQSTLDLGALGAGSHNFSLNGAIGFDIQVTKSAAPVWTRISEDTNRFVQFYAPRSVAVNKNSSSPYFGRIYVMDHAAGPTAGTTGSGRTVTKGIFALNPDLSDALGQGDTGLKGGLDSFLGLDGVGLLGGNSRFEPWKIAVGDDDYVYIADAQDPRGSISRVDANIANGELVLEGVGNTAAPSVHTIVYGLAVKGSLANNNLTVWGTDGQWQGNTACNSVLRWDINGGPLPFGGAPTQVAQPGFPTIEIEPDLDVAPDGNVFVLLFRSNVDAGGLKVYSSTGQLLWTSLIGGSDVFLNCRMLAVSPDNSKLAVVRADQRTVVVALTNGPSGRLPDMSQTNAIQTFTSTSTGNGRTVTWDLAGNLYVANPSSELLRVWSPGGTTTASTKSDGTFNITVPQTTVTITNSVTQTAENSGTPIVFTLNRSGNTATPLTVNLLVSGTASNGVHYTPAIPTSITFAAGAVSTNITVTPVDNNVAEFSKTITVQLGGGTNYSGGTPSSVTATILDNETPEISIALAQTENRLLEGYSAAKLSFRVTRKGLLTDAPTVNLVYSGQASRGTKFNGPLTVALPASAVNATFSITPINNQIYEGNQTVVAGIAAGSGYTIAATNTAAGLIIDDEVSPGTTLFSDNFNSPSTDASDKWAINSQDFFTETHADFGFDYTSLGVPALPGGTDTLALRLRCNENTVGAAAIAISLSPLGLDLGTNDYRMSFNMWINYNGPMLNGGAGSTYHLNAGVGTTGDHPNWLNWFGADGVWFSVDGDGGSTTAAGDANAYIGQELVSEASGVYSAGKESGVRNTTHPFYSLWGGIPAPAAQVTLYPADQTGTSQPGNMGVSWHTVVITKVTNTVIWKIDGVTIATVTNDPAMLSTNVFVGYHDQFAGSSGTPAMSFALIDNLKVMTYTDLPPTPPAAPNITKIAVGSGNVQINFTGGGADTTSSFTVQSSQTVNGTYLDSSATITGGSGSFQATLPLNGDTRFYRIKR